MTNFVASSVKRQLRSLLVEIQLQGCYPRGDIRLGDLQFAMLVGEFRTALRLAVPLLGLLFPAQRTHQDFAAGGVWLCQ